MEDLNKKLVETSSADIATTDENMSYNDMFQQIAFPSLAKRIAALKPINGPTAALFAIKTDAGKLVLLRQDIEVQDTEMIKTDVTVEVLQDIESQFGIDGVNAVLKMLRGEANIIENEKLIEFLEFYAKDNGVITPDTSTLEFSYNITSKIQNAILEMNTDSYRTHESFALVPAAGMSALLTRGLLEDTENNEEDLYMGKHGKTSYLLNPFNNNVYVGLKSKENEGRTAITYSSFQNELIKVLNPDSGDIGLNIVNRFALTINPLHEATNPMLIKFTIA